MLKAPYIAATLSAAMTLLVADASAQQDYPTKPIRIVTSSVGGGGDFAARLIAQGISGPLGQQVIVDNRPSGVIPGETVAKAPPDGFTVLVTGGSHWLGALLRKLPYDPLGDFTPIALMFKEPSILVVHPSVPVKSVKELVALAKAKPGALNYALSGIGGSTHLSAELFNSLAGVKIVGISYKGGAHVNALLGGEVELMYASSNQVASHLKSGKLRALAVTSAEPTELAPGLPTVAATLPGYESVGMTGMFAPAKTSATIIGRLNQETVRFLNNPDMKPKLSASELEVATSSPEQFATIIKAEMSRMSKVIKDAGIRVE